MLEYKELEDIARLKRISLVNAEKDHIQNLILYSIYSRAGKEFIFKGGTCLYKIYKLNRFSEDLDFTLTERKNTEQFAQKILYDLSLFNVNGVIKEIKEHKTDINIRLLFKGPLFKGGKETQCFIPLNISLKEKASLEPVKKQIISLYSEINNFEVFAMQDKEILSEKVRAILTREKPRDVYDLWFLLNIGTGIDFHLINEKLKLYNKSFDFDDFFNAISRKRNLWDLDLKNLIINDLPDFNNVYKEILSRFKLK